MAQSKPKGRLSGLFDPKFDIALNLAPARIFKERLEQEDSIHQDLEYKRLNQQIPLSRLKSAVIGVSVIGIIFQFVLTTFGFSHCSRLQDHLRIARDFIAIQEDHLFSNSTDTILKGIQTLRNLDIKSKLLIPDQVKQFWDSCIEFDRALDVLQSVKEAAFDPKNPLQGLATIFNGKMSITFGRQLCVLSLNHVDYLLTKDQFLMIHNKMLETFNCLFLCWQLSDVCWSFEFYRKSVDVIRYMSYKVQHVGNLAYEIFKSFDALATAYIMRKQDDVNQNIQYENLITSLKDDRIITEWDVRCLDVFFNDGNWESLEISGMSKLLGHPDINTFAGLTKLRKRVMAQNPVTLKKISELLDYMKKNFCFNFFKKHKKWPKVSWTSFINPTLQHCILAGKWIDSKTIPANYRPVLLSDFSSITLEQNVEFDYIECQFPILKDTALTYTKSQLESPALHTMRNLENKRTLLFFLLNQNPPELVRSYMDDFSSRDPDALEYCVIKLTQKERELKPEGRYFGSSPYQERARRCILEMNLANAMDLYNPSQFMTLSELEKFRRMYTFAKLAFEDEDHFTAYISIDVEAFNNGFRRAFCEPIGEHFFDALFGTAGIFKTFMDVYELSDFLCSDQEYDYTWTSQFGGIEGLSQKAWTWIYESVASRVSEMTGCPFYIMVNGDDLRVVLLIPKSMVQKENLSEYLTRIQNDFATSYGEFGFRLKIQETYASSSLLGFGKTYISNRVWMTSTLKKGCKIHGLANLLGDLPLEYIKGAMSECQSTMSYSVNHHHIYILGIINVLRYLRKFISDFPKLTDNEVLTLLLIPSTFGGLPILPYIRTLAKGDSDLETIWLDLYQWISTTNSPLFINICHILSQTLTTSRLYHGLASNPFSLPLTLPNTGMARLQQAVREVLPKIVKNIKFKEILREANPIATRSYIQQLYSSDVIPAKAFSVIYETSAPGVIDEFVQKFTSAKSMTFPLIQLKGYRFGRRVVSQARECDLKRIRTLVGLVKGTVSLPKNPKILNLLKNSPLTHPCSTHLSDDLRELCWNKPLIGITYPCPIEQLRFSIPEPGANIPSNAFTVWVQPIPVITNINYSHGKSNMFLGLHTELKLHSPTIQLKGSAPAVRRIDKLLKVYSLFTKLGDPLQVYIERNLEDLTGIPASLLLSSVYRLKSGTISHRVPANHWSPVVGLNELPNRSSFITSTTKTDDIIRMKSGDYTINFGYLRAMEVILTLYATEFQSEVSCPDEYVGYIELNYNCDYCIRDVADKEINWVVTPRLVGFDISGNPYVGFTEDERRKLTDQLLLQNEIRKSHHPLKLREADHHDKLLAQQYMVDQVISAYTDPTHNRELLNQHLNITEEELLTIHGLKLNRAIGLTELKLSSPKIVMSQLILSFISWIFQQYPRFVREFSVQQILDLPMTHLPFKAFSEAMLETLYLEILRPELKRLLPRISLATPKTSIGLQRILVQACCVDFKQRVSSRNDPPPFQATILVTSYPDDETFCLHLDNQLNKQGWKVFLNWILSPSGRTLAKDTIEGRYSSILFELYYLHILGVSVLEIERVYAMGDFPVFSTESRRKNLLTTFLKSLNLNSSDFEKILKDTLAYGKKLLPLESLPIPKTIKYLYDARVRIIIIDQGDAIELARSQQDSTYQEYFKELKKNPKHQEKPSSKETLVRSNLTSVTWVSDVDFQRDNAVVPEPIKRNQQNYEEHNFPHHFASDPIPCSAACWRILGYNSSAGVKLLEILQDIVNLSRRNTGNVICTADQSGGFTRVCALYYKEATIVFNSLPSDMPEASVSVPECSDLPLKDQRRIKFRNVLNRASDLRSELCCQELLRDCDQQANIFLITCDCEYYPDLRDTLKIVSTLLLCVRSKGDINTVLVYKTLFYRGSHCMLLLQLLNEQFNKVKIVKPKSSYEWSYEVYLVCQGFNFTGTPWYAWFTSKTSDQLTRFKLDFLKSRNQGLEMIPKLSYRSYNECIHRFKTIIKPLNVSPFQHLLGMIVNEIMDIEPQDNWKDYLLEVQKLVTLKIELTKALVTTLITETLPTHEVPKKLRVDSGNIRHQCRLLYEYQLMKLSNDWLIIHCEHNLKPLYVDGAKYLENLNITEFDFVPHIINSLEFLRHMDFDEWKVNLTKRKIALYRFMFVLYYSRDV